MTNQHVEALQDQAISAAKADAAVHGALFTFSVGQIFATKTDEWATTPGIGCLYLYLRAYAEATRGAQ